MEKTRLKFGIWLMVCLMVSGLLGLATTSSWAEVPTVKWTNENITGVSSPAIGKDGTIYVGSANYEGDSFLYAVNPDDVDSVKWAFKTEQIIYSSPVIGKDGTIYIGSDDTNLYAVNPDGNKKWAFKTDDIITTSPAISADGTIYICAGNKIYAIDSEGVKKWDFTTEEDDFIDSSPAIGSDGTIYIGSAYQKLYAINSNGKKEWTLTTGDSIFSSPAIGADNTIYVGSMDKKLYAITPDGTNKWNFEITSTMGNIGYSSAAIGKDGTIYIGSYDSNIYAIDPDGTKKWSFQTSSMIESSPAIGADDTVYIVASDGNLYAINPDDGQEKWHLKIGNSVISSPAISADGTIYVLTDEGLKAINSNSEVTSDSHPWSMFRHDARHTGRATSMPEWIKISGTIEYEGIPLCAMVLANGQHMFTCDDNQGKYELKVPLDENGQVTLFGFCDGLAPFKQILTPDEESIILNIEMIAPSSDSKILMLDPIISPIPDSDWVNVSGDVLDGETPLCAMILINGQHMFSCDENLGKFDLDVPVDSDGNITVFGFCDGFMPFKSVIKVE